MSFIAVGNAGEFGIIKDRAPHTLPENAWSDGNNVRFQDGYASRAYGDVRVKGTLLGQPYFLMPAYGETPVWGYTDMLKWWAVAGGTHQDITRSSGGDYTGDVTNKWTGDWLNGVMILTNGVDHPQAWNPITPSTRLIDLPDWDDGDRALVFRSLKNYFIALNVTKGSTEYPTLVKWSDVTLPGSLPGSWDETDPANQAGEFPLSATPGPIVDGLRLRESLVIYKYGSMSLMTWVGGNDIFRFDTISNSVGALGTGCVVELPTGQHLVFTDEFDVVVHNGRDVESVIDGRLRRFLQQDVNDAAKGRAFVVADYFLKHALICYPSGESEIPNKALVWDWISNTWSQRDLPQTYDAKSGFDSSDSLSSLLLWEDEVEFDWDDGEPLELSATAILRPGQGAMFSDYQDSKLTLYGPETGRIDDQPFKMTVERKGIAYYGRNRQGHILVDLKKMKVCTAIRPIIDSEIPTVVKVWVASYNYHNEDVVYEGPYAFNTALDKEIFVLLNGRFLAIKMEHEDPNTDLQIYGYELQIQEAGKGL